MGNAKQPLSKQILQRLLERGLVEKSRKALQNVQDACDFLEKQGIEITVAAVGNFCAGRPGGPVAQSIRNNKDLKAYVVARRSEQVRTSTTRRAHGSSPIRTGDLNADAYIQTIEFELSQARAELRSLRAAIPKLGEYDLRTAIETGQLVISAPMDQKLRPEAISAIRTLLDARALAAVGLSLTPTGQLISPEFNDAILLSKAETDALRSLITGGVS